MGSDDRFSWSDAYSGPGFGSWGVSGAPAEVARWRHFATSDGGVTAVRTIQYRHRENPLDALTREAQRLGVRAGDTIHGVYKPGPDGYMKLDVDTVAIERAADDE